MLEVTSSRHNALIDPVLAVWSWEIPFYLFVGGVVAGMMVLGGIAMLRIAKGEDGRSFFSMQTPLLAELPLVPEVRIGGDSGNPAALAGKDSPVAAPFFALAETVRARVSEQAARKAPSISLED